MEELLHALLHWVAANPGWAYAIVLATALAESLAVVGVVVPGVMIMLGAGALIGTGVLQFWPIFFAAVAGAIAGDGLSFWLGRHYRHQICGWWPFSRHPQQLTRGILFFQRHGAKSVVIGRFFGPVRAMVPLVAGMMRMTPGRFAAANVGSALAWAPAYLAPGIVFGASLKLAAEAATRLAILLLILIGVLWACAWMARRLFWFFSPRANAWVQALLRWVDLHPKLARIAQALAEPTHPDARALTALAGALLLATALLGVSVSIGMFGPQDLSINQIALDLGQSLHTPFANTIMATLGRLAAPSVVLTIAVAVFAYLRWRGRKRDGGYWLAACGFVLIATPSLGWLLRIPRPDLGLQLQWPWSFPSAAVLSATLTYGFLAILLSAGIKGRGRWLPYGFAAVIIASVALARLYFGTEWLTDVLGSIGLGLAWISALGLSFRRHSRRVTPWVGLALVAAFSTGASVLLAGWIRPATDPAEYRPQLPPQVISMDAWRARDCELLPSHREDLWQRNRRPFLLAYAGDLSALAAALDSLGWKPAERLAWDNAMKLLSPSLPIAELPVIPHVHAGHHEQFALVKEAGAEQRLVLRLWATRCRIDDGPPVWSGDVTILHKENVVDLLSLPVTSADHESARQSLLDDLQAAQSLATQPGNPLLIATKRSGLLP
jgi:membrane protein DedA with SNARE-associated domain/membrane-associated phospholipid phosphatase